MALQPSLRRGDRLELYASSMISDARFDGYRAQNHLTSNLGMRILAVNQLTNIRNGFATWLGENAQLISVHPRDRSSSCRRDGIHSGGGSRDTSGFWHGMLFEGRMH